MNKEKEKGYTKELLDFTKELNPHKIEEEIIKDIQDLREELSKKFDCEIDCIQLSINKDKKEIKIDVKI